IIGVAAGVLSGLFGIGGGILLVPALALVLGLDHVEAEATSLLAIIPVAAVGAWRQKSYGNLDVRSGLTIGAFAAVAAVAGVALVNVLPVELVRYAFAALMLYVAWRMASSAIKQLRAGNDPALPDGQ
ncbi:MAG: TSUP family transporter, partial [Solirubrobacteraceae bacterium]|nr:TSUP family transporter [Solirubrobacteraceae bacterium]